MIFYVCIIWICAALFLVALEYIFFSFEATLLPGLSFVHALPTQWFQGNELNQMPFALDLFLLLCFFILSLIGGYLLEAKLNLVWKVYSGLQKSYPKWYQSLPASHREIYLALGSSLGLSLLLTSTVYFKSHSDISKTIYTLVCSLGFSIGTLILPIMRYRTLLLEDRPEKPPEALIQKVIPQYPHRRALIIGQIYLKFLLPLFSLFILLILPLSLKKLTFSGLEMGVLLMALFIGLALGWWASKDSQIYIENFRDNFIQLIGIVSISGGLLLFGAFSGNLLLLFMMGTFSAYLCATY